MLNNRQIYLLVIVSVAVIVLCLCDNKPEEFCNIQESHTILEHQNTGPNVVVGIQDERFSNLSNVNMLSTLDCDINMNNHILFGNNYGKMKASVEPEFPDYSRL
jgi:hypothetical protein